MEENINISKETLQKLHKDKWTRITNAKNFNNYIQSSRPIIIGVPMKKLVMLLCPLFQAPITPPSERHQERNQKVTGRSRSWGPPGNLLVSHLVSLRGSYGSFKKCADSHLN
jgi:hypothetical protein